MANGGLEKALQRAITTHAWNADRTQLAVCPNNNEVQIYGVKGTNAADWVLLHVLKEHDSLVSGIDWCPHTNNIVTCGHDRNSYVWKLTEEGTWSPTLVILRINRAAITVKWSPSGKKFAVTSGAKVVPVCHYEQGNDWWVSKTIKKHKSTVLALDWNRNNKFIVTGCADFKCRIFSAFIDDVDEDVDNESWADIFPNQTRFGAQLAEFDSAGGWVESVAWAPSGYRLAFAAHDSNVYFVQILAGEPPTCQTVTTPFLPFLAIVFLSDDGCVFGGYDSNPVLFINKGTDAEPVFEVHGVLDKEISTPNSKKAVSSFSNARNLFDASSRMGLSFGADANDTDGTLKTRHQNAINGLIPFWSDEERYTAKEFSSCGIDGRVLLWDMTKLPDVNLAAIGLE